MTVEIERRLEERLWPLKSQLYLKVLILKNNHKASLFLEYLKCGLSIFAYKNTINMKRFVICPYLNFRKENYIILATVFISLVILKAKVGPHFGIFYLSYKILLLKLGWQINAANNLKIKYYHSSVIFRGHPEWILKSNACFYL